MLTSFATASTIDSHSELAAAERLPNNKFRRLPHGCWKKEDGERGTGSAGLLRRCCCCVLVVLWK
jgi:hypothetical protein